MVQDAFKGKVKAKVKETEERSSGYQIYEWVLGRYKWVNIIVF